MAGVRVVLTWREAYEAAVEGAKRHLRMIHGGVPHGCRKGARRPANEWDDHIEGTGAEAAFGKWAGLDWRAEFEAGKLRDGGVDIGGTCIRHTAHGGGHLLIQTRDHDELPAVLVTGRLPVYRLAGWLPVGEAKKVGKWNTYDDWPAAMKRNLHPCWWIAQNQLRPMSDFERASPGS